MASRSKREASEPHGRAEKAAVVPDPSQSDASETGEIVVVPSRSRPLLLVGGQVRDQATTANAPDSPEDHRPAAGVRLGTDDRNRQVILTELLAEMRAKHSDVTCCVLLATAKLAHEALHPETRQGGAPGKVGGGKKALPKDPDSGSFVTLAVRATGWKRSRLSVRVKIGSGICESAYRLSLGSLLANRIGDLDRMSSLEPAQQVEVARDYSLNLARQARAKLNQYCAERERLEADNVEGGGGSSEESEANRGRDERAQEGAHDSAPEEGTEQQEPGVQGLADGAPSEILTALGATTVADALTRITQLRQRERVAELEIEHLREEVTKLEKQRDKFLAGGAIGAVLRELGAASMKEALVAIKELKAHATA